MHHSSKSTLFVSLLASLWGLAACAGAPEPFPHPGGGGTATGSDLKQIPPLPFLAPTDGLRQLDTQIDEHFQRNATRRAYIMVDKPLYQPGETLWFRANLRHTSTFAPRSGIGLTAQLVSPRGSIVGQKRILVQEGVAANDFVIPDEAQGGEYTLQITTDDGTTAGRPVIISTYEPPRLKKTLEFLRKAYGPGDTVKATLEIKRQTGEPFAHQGLTAVVVLDGAEVARVPVSTDGNGQGLVSFELPGKIETGDGLLTVLAADGGMTESIQKRVPIVLDAIRFSMFPEGGDLVAGLPGRVYFSAENTLGKPADVEGRVLDDRGREVSTFRSVRDGLGRFELRPEVGRSYRVAITRPAGIRETFEVPAAKKKGCVLRSLDDYASKDRQLAVAAYCTRSQPILVEAVLREKRVASGAVYVQAGKPGVIALPVDPHAQGAVRVTLFDEEKNPLAERLVYRGRHQDLLVEIQADKPTYTPRERVTLRVKTTDAQGRPVSASLGVSVVDDTVLSFADDKTANLLAHMYLVSELGADVELEDPSFYFSQEPGAAEALDMVLGTKGWRRFEWQLVLSPPKVTPTGAATGYVFDDDVDFAPVDLAPAEVLEAPRAQPAPPPPAPGKARPPVRLGEGQRDVKKVAKEKVLVEGRVAKPDVAGNRERGPMLDRRRRAGAVAVAGDLAMDEEEWAGGEDKNLAWGWAPVRVFPVPDHDPGYEGPRTDFRETIYWAPDVRTGIDGTATVTFPVSDAVTSFRATAEGFSAGGLAGRGEVVIQSKMPLSLDAYLPLEVSAGDRIELPVTVANETRREMTGELTAVFGAAFRLEGGVDTKATVTLKPGSKKTFFFPLHVVGQGAGAGGDVEIAVAAAGLKDEIKKTIRVVPLGFPFEVSLSGTLEGSQKHVVDLSGALPGTLVASVKMYPSPLSTMTSGTEAILREPSGCFEQTSSANYPNVMVLSYLEENDAAAPELVERASGMIDRGYKRLIGFETKERGYEWFGSAPGHEALTAYGIMEFEDMARIYGDVDRAMIDRTAKWLLGRRDQKGGFERNPKALDSFGRASYETTNGYIVWALTEAGRAGDLAKELDAQKKVGLESKDPYLVALAANAWLNVDAKSDATKTMVKRLAAMQDRDGSFPGARETITMSGGQSLAIETTALATLALLRASSAGQEYEGEIRKGVEYLNGTRSGHGMFGSTQGTILALKTLATYASHSRRTPSAGTAIVLVNGREAGRIAFDKGHRDTLVFDDLVASLRPGKNTIELRLEGEGSMPYSVAIGYRSDKPQSSPVARVDVTTRLAAKSVPLGEGVRLTARVENRTDEGIPMTLARVGIPGGLTFQTWQLKELRDKGLIDFYETGEREVILYFRAMKPGDRREIPIDLMARVPGRTVAPATSAYLYYTPEDKAWSPPLEIEVKRPGSGGL